MEQKMTTQEFKEKLTMVAQAFKNIYDPKYNTFHYNGYDFVCTSHACPEQYDVYKGNYKNGNHVAYVRKRWGHLSVHPVINEQIDWDTVIYKEFEGDDFNGVIDNKEKTFENIVNVLNKTTK